jgi:murein DD-endopeptidase
MIRFIILFINLLSAISVSAQFNTISSESAISRLNTRKNIVEDSAARKGNNDVVRNEAIKHYMSVSYPLDNVVVTSPYGMRKDPFSGKNYSHKGIDLRAKFQPVYAMMHGTVIKVAQEKKGGLYVIIRHGNYEITYCHLSQSLVRKGCAVKPGDVVAVSGASGTRCTGPHLHIGVKYKGKTINPMIMLGFIRQTRESVLRELTSHCGAYAPDSLSKYIDF